MLPIADVLGYLKVFAPLELAEQWDNVGLLFGDAEASVQRILTCLTLTPNVADEAIACGAQLIVSHHPILFRPVQRLTSETPQGKLLLALARAGVAVYSPHTAFDSAQTGVNQQLAELFGLGEIAPLRPLPVDSPLAPLGSGRCGRLPAALTLAEFCQTVKRTLSLPAVQAVGDPHQPVSKVGIACGSAAEFLPDARRLGCDVLLTGEARFHACLEAIDLEISLVLAGHYATERPAVEHLAQVLAQQFPGLEVRASQRERDPLQWM